MEYPFPFYGSRTAGRIGWTTKIYSIVFKAPPDRANLETLARFWVQSLADENYWEEPLPGDGLDQFCWCFADRLAAFAVSSLPNIPKESFHGTLERFFKRTNFSIGIVDVVDHSAPESPKTRTPWASWSLAQGPPAAGNAPPAVDPAHCRARNELDSALSGSREFFDLCMLVHDQDLQSVLAQATATSPGFAARHRGRITPSADPTPAWFSEPHVFLESDYKLSVPCRAAWDSGAQGLVMERDGKRVVSPTSEGYGSYSFNIGDERQYDGEIVISTHYEGWVFDCESGKGTFLIGRDNNTDRVESVRKIPDGALMLAQGKLRLYRAIGATLSRVAELEVQGETIDLVLGARAAVVHGDGGASLVAIAGKTLKLLKSIKLNDLRFLGERTHEGHQEVRLLSPSSRQYAFTEVDRILAQVQEAAEKLEQEPAGPHAFGIGTPLPSAFAFGKNRVYSPRRRGNYSYGVHVKHDNRLCLQVGDQAAVELQFEHKLGVSTVSENGAIFVGDKAANKVFAVDRESQEPRLVYQPKANCQVQQIFAVGDVLYVREEKPNAIRRLVERDGRWVVTHTCKLRAKAGPFAATESVIASIEWGHGSAVTLFGLPTSKRKKSFDKLLVLPDQYTNVWIHAGKLVLRRSWDPDLHWEIRGL